MFIISSTAMANMPDEQGSAERSLGKLGQDVIKGRNCQFFTSVMKHVHSTPGLKRARASVYWKPFINFQREVQGNVVMKGREKLVGDMLPGKKTLQKMVLFKDLPALKPQYAEVSGVKWLTSESAGQSGRLEFPGSFSGNVPVQFATRELLSYYGVTIAGNLNSLHRT